MSKSLEKSMVAKAIVWSKGLFFWKPSQIDWDKRKSWLTIKIPG